MTCRAQARGKTLRDIETAYMRTAEGRRCESCGIENGTTVGCHFNIDKGGTGYRVPGAIAWLCSDCHDIVDRRVIVPERERGRVLERIIQTMGVERFDQYVEQSE